MAELLFKEESFKIIGICMEIHKNLGMGLKEINYKDDMEFDFIEHEINYYREKKFTVKYEDKILRNTYIADFAVYDSTIIEVKSVTAIIDAHMAQALG